MLKIVVKYNLPNYTKKEALLIKKTLETYFKQDIQNKLKTIEVIEE